MRAREARVGRVRSPDVAAAAVIVAVFVAVVVRANHVLREPFWYDEQWRAYFVSVRRDWWSQLRSSNAPMSAGWYAVERLGIATVGNHEITLRFANVVWLLPLGLAIYVVARRWVRPVVGLVLAVAAMLNGLLVSYALQLKPFVADAAGTMVVVAALLYAREARSPGRRVTAFVAATLGLLVATPAVFVAGPLVLCLLYDWWRRARDRVLLWGSIGTLLVAALHLRLFVMRQNELSKGSYWDPDFVPRSSLSAALRFIGDRTSSYVPGFVTAGYQPRDAGRYPIPVTHAWTVTVTVTVLVLLAFGVWQAALTQPGRYVLFATAMTFPLMLFASALRLWPYGFVRVNIFVVPLLYLMCGLGAVRLWQLGRAALGRTAAGAPGVRVVAVGTALLCAAGLGGTGAALAVSASVSTPAVRPGSALAGYGRNLDLAVQRVRREADATTGVLVAGALAVRGWQYYLFQHDGSPGAQVPPGRVLLLDRHDAKALAAFAAAHRDLTRLYYYTPLGATGAEVRADEGALRGAGFCHRAEWHYAQSGLLVELDRC